MEAPDSRFVLQEMRHLQEGTLLEGTVRKIFPYGAQIRIGETNRRLVDESIKQAVKCLKFPPYPFLFCSLIRLFREVIPSNSYERDCQSLDSLSQIDKIYCFKWKSPVIIVILSSGLLFCNVLFIFDFRFLIFFVTNRTRIL